MKKAKSKLEIVNPNAAGIDIGSAVHYVCVPEGGDEQRVQKFGCFTEDLHNLAEWLKKCKVTSSYGINRSILDSFISNT